MEYQPRVCIDNAVTESVQYYTVRSKFQVTTFTALDHLAIKDECECTVKSACERPRHLVFVIDGSDSFNYDIMGKDGKKESSWFDKIKDFLVDFVESANFDMRTAPTLLSVYQFSGLKQCVANYKPGTGGKDAKTGEFHYRCVIDAIQVTASSMKTKKDMVERIKKTVPLDGAGMLHLILQDLTMKPFMDKATAKFSTPPPGVTADEWIPENVMVIITDDQWDTKGLKNDRGLLSDEKEIIRNTSNAYSKIYGASGQLILTDAMKSDQFLMHQLVKPMEKAMLFTQETMTSKLNDLKSRIFADLQL